LTIVVTLDINLYLNAFFFFRFSFHAEISEFLHVIQQRLLKSGFGVVFLFCNMDNKSTSEVCDVFLYVFLVCVVISGIESIPNTFSDFFKNSLLYLLV
jgi:hypothetical protein